MKITINYLNKAYALIDAGDFQLAINILEALVSAEPANVEAWEAYMQICNSCEALDDLCERVLEVSEISQADRESILDYYYFLRQRLRSCAAGERSPRMVTFELVDQFTYTLKDRSSISSEHKESVDFGQWFAWMLGKAILIPYVALLLIGLNLLSLGNDFGYWTLMALALSIFIRVWKIVFPAAAIDRKQPGYKSAVSGVRSDPASHHPELIS